MRAASSAPGKVILFGEHAVVYGHPAVAAVTDQRTTVEVHCCGDRFTVNGYKIHERYHSYLLSAVERVWKGEPVRLQTEGGVPSASGTGSSAALTVACVASLLRLQGNESLASVAQESFGVERATQGGGSPVDTSCSTAGGAIAIAGKPPSLGSAAWECQWEDACWYVESVPVRPLTVVVGNSGVKSRTDEQVQKVARAMKNPIVRDSLAEMGEVAREAVGPLAAGDLEGLGRLMTRAHRGMHTIGVNHPAVERLVTAAIEQPGTWGAKITGAGGGGSMVALTDRPEELAAVLDGLGAKVYVLTLGGEGVRPEMEVAVPPSPLDA